MNSYTFSHIAMSRARLNRWGQRMGRWVLLVGQWMGCVNGCTACGLIDWMPLWGSTCEFPKLWLGVK